LSILLRLRLVCEVGFVSGEGYDEQDTRRGVRVLRELGWLWESPVLVHQFLLLLVEGESAGVQGRSIGRPRPLPAVGVRSCRIVLAAGIHAPLLVFPIADTITRLR